MKYLLSAVVAALVLLPSGAEAQEGPPRPEVFVLSQQKCNLATTNELNRWFVQTAAPILDDLVSEGRLIGWGLLEHTWGDEWNNVIYYTATDFNAFQAAYNDYFRRLVQRQPDVMQLLARHCTEHKDNIYTVVATETPAEN